MPRVAEGRAPAQPHSPEQQERVHRILRAAARQGAESGLERVQMQEIAKESGVAIATLYRYFPSKMHLFTQVMRAQVERVGNRTTRQHSDGSPPHPSVQAPSPGPVHQPVQAVTDLLLAATAEMMAAPLLAHAMLMSNNATLHGDDGRPTEASEAIAALLFDTAGIAEPTVRDHQLVRLIEQSWYGVINSALNLHTSMDQLDSDIRASCELLLGEWNHR